MTIKPYNPLELDNLAEDIVRALERSPALCLRDIQRFPGAGIYLLYYAGDFPEYAPVSNHDPEDPKIPIYVGRAKRAGARKGAHGRGGTTGGQELYERLGQHRASVESATNLSSADFRASFLVVDEIWIPLGEQLLLRRYRPLWNAVVDGFGNHNPGGGRFEGKRPTWDVLHPGRPWAEKCKPSGRSFEEIRADIENHLLRIDDDAGHQPDLTLDPESDAS